MSVLVTGGTGYIGSHTVVVLLEAGYDVVIADNLYNSKLDVLDKIETITGIRPRFYQCDVSSKEELNVIFNENKIDSILHFAGYKAVGESVGVPLKYYRNNLLGTIALAECALAHNVSKFIFSSSATVYGDGSVPYHESNPLMPSTNPYGETKVMSERILSDTAKVNPSLNVTLLRYFNPIGAHKSGLIGEIPVGTPNNLMPYITQVAKGKLERLRVFGNDYNTVDGTGVRDYVHVVDLAYGHMAALEKMRNGINIYNLGTGKGTSVLELIHTFQSVNNITIPYDIVDRRPGDVASSYADVSKAWEELGWKTQKNLQDMCHDSWFFEKNQ
jgi:UDP-glucose 4-epimerase